MSTAQPSDRPALPASRWATLLTVTGTALVILTVMNPWLVLQANTPTGGDMGAHVFAPIYLREVLLPEWRLQGWSNDWYAGFPIYYFYFPLPSLFIVLLDLFVPYGVAFKVVTIAGLVALPAATYFLTRCFRFGRTVAAVTAAGAATFVFMESFSIYGGNIASSLAGEFSFSWSFALSLVYLGLLVRAVRDDRKYLVWAALALAAAALCHLITTIVAVVASIPLMTWRHGFRRTVAAWLWGFTLAAVWAVPLLVRIGLSSDLAWTPLRTWEELFPIEIWLLLPPAVAGMIWGASRTPRVAPMIVATVLPLIYYPLPILLPALLPGFFGEERWKLWNGRLLPYWYFGVVFFAAITVGWGATALARRLPDRISRWWPRGVAVVAGVVAVVLMARPDSQIPNWVPWVAAMVMAAGVGTSLLWGGPVTARTVLTVSSAAVLSLGALAGVTFVDGWARWNYQGYEGKEPWPEYQALMQTVSGLPPGRVHWEYSKEMDKYGTPMALMLMPLWTGGTHPSMEGLFFESSLSTPFHFLNQAEMSVAPSQPVPGLAYHRQDFDRGLAHLEIYNVRYYVSYTPEATQEADQRPELTEVASSPPFTIYELPPSSLVEVATHVPGVYQADESARGPLTTPGALVEEGGSITGTATPTFNDMALDWYDRLDLLDRWLVAEGPSYWPRIDTVGDLAGADNYTRGGSVSEIVLEDHRISFRTTAVGLPHLVKVSFFPNWTAVGAEGPFRAAPSLMVVVPTQEEVVLEFRNTWAENVGNILTLLGLGGVGAAVLVPWLRRRRAA